MSINNDCETRPTEIVAKRFSVIYGTDHVSYPDAVEISKSLGFTDCFHGYKVPQPVWRRLDLQSWQDDHATVHVDRRPVRKLAAGEMTFSSDVALTDLFDAVSGGDPPTSTPATTPVGITVVLGYLPGIVVNEGDGLRHIDTWSRGDRAPTRIPAWDSSAGILISPGWCRMHVFLVVDSECGELTWLDCS